MMSAPMPNDTTTLGSSICGVHAEGFRDDFIVQYTYLLAEDVVLNLVTVRDRNQLDAADVAIRRAVLCHFGKVVEELKC